MFFTWAQVETEARGGAFHYFGADGVLMVFGPLVAQKDHAQRAVLAGLKLQERLHERCLALNIQPTVEAAVRLGLHSGPIELCGMTDDLASSSLTRADVATLAIRLRYLAKAGQLLTSMATVPLIEEIVEMVEYGAVRMPGHTDSMMAYRICRLVLKRDQLVL
jgi:class 3 adenylate cyclase